MLHCTWILLWMWMCEFVNVKCFLFCVGCKFSIFNLFYQSPCNKVLTSAAVTVSSSYGRRHSCKMIQTRDGVDVIRRVRYRWIIVELSQQRTHHSILVLVMGSILRILLRVSSLMLPYICISPICKTSSHSLILEAKEDAMSLSVLPEQERGGNSFEVLSWTLPSSK